MSNPKISCLHNHPLGSIDYLSCLAAGRSVCEERKNRKLRKFAVKNEDKGPVKQVIKIEPIIPEPEILISEAVKLDEITHAQAKITADQQLIEKLKSNYDKKLHDLEDERKREQEQLQDVMNRELETLERLESERKNVEIKTRIDKNLKTIATIKKKVKAQKTEDKLERMSRGESANTKVSKTLLRNSKK